MRRTTLKAYPTTIDWFESAVVDWNSAGEVYYEDGNTKTLQKYHFGFVCDGSITSSDGTFAVIYQKLGTKALLLKNGEVHREINRSYYQSEVYEFPVTLWEWNDKIYLIHCPNKYCQLDIEDAETGEILTNIPNRNPHDFFHSRLEVSPNNRYLLSKGWVWHPFDTIEVFDIQKSMDNPLLFDKPMYEPTFYSEIHSASFVDDDRILLCSEVEEFDEEDPFSDKNIGVWNFKTNEISQMFDIKPLGNVFAIDGKRCWDLYQYPKIIDLTSGQVIDKIEEVFSGNQGSSIIHHLEELPKIAFNKKTKQVAIAHKDTIEILTP